LRTRAGIVIDVVLHEAGAAELAIDRQSETERLGLRRSDP
jgi:hypothetical protein